MPANLPRKLVIFDKILRADEQSPDVSMARDEQIRIAKQLARMKVDAAKPGKQGYIIAKMKVLLESTLTDSL